MPTAADTCRRHAGHYARRCSVPHLQTANVPRIHRGRTTTFIAARAASRHCSTGPDVAGRNYLAPTLNATHRICAWAHTTPRTRTHHSRGRKTLCLVFDEYLVCTGTRTTYNVPMRFLALESHAHRTWDTAHYTHPTLPPHPAPHTTMPHTLHAPPCHTCHCTHTNESHLAGVALDAGGRDTVATFAGQGGRPIHRFRRRPFLTFALLSRAAPFYL